MPRSGAEDVRRPAVARLSQRPWRRSASRSADDDVIVSPATFAGGVAAIERAWAAGRRPTAVLAMSDAIAIGAIRGAARPAAFPSRRDVSVVGFDDIELAETTDPPLTTVHQPIRGKGEEAARLLLSVHRRPRGSRRATAGWRPDSSSGHRPRSAPRQQGR